jgi:hypothetical protein
MEQMEQLNINKKIGQKVKKISKMQNSIKKEV